MGTRAVQSLSSDRTALKPANILYNMSCTNQECGELWIWIFHQLKKK